MTARLLQEYRTRKQLSASEANSGSGLPVKSEPRALRSMAKVRCFRCKRFGHFKRDCKAPKKTQQSPGFHRAMSDDEKGLVAHGTLPRHTTFIMDSGATSHMVSDSSLLIRPTMRRGTPGYVSIGDGRRLQCQGQGTVLLKSRTRASEHPAKIMLLRKTLFVPEMDCNLLSCSALSGNGFYTVFSNSECQIKKNNEVIAVAEREGGLYVLHGTVDPVESANVAKLRLSGANLWHQRYGHVNARSIQDMDRQNAVLGMDLNEKACRGRDCEYWVKGKMARSTLRGRGKKSLKPGERIFSDVCGLMSVESIGGARYFVSFSDAGSGYRKIKILKNKSGVYDAFVEFMRKFERQYDCRVKALYSDNGGEFEALSKFLQNHGIEDEYSAAYTPEQNGISERLNRTLIDMVRSMLDQAQLTPSFWAEAATTAVELRNVTGSRQRGGMTPHELLTGRKPDVRNLRVFGCEAWIHVPKQQRRKLDLKARRGIVLRSFPNGNYRVWDIERKRAVVTRHVIVNELKFPAREWSSREANSKALTLWYRELYPEDTTLGTFIVNSDGEEQMEISSDDDNQVDNGKDNPLESSADSSQETQQPGNGESTEDSYPTDKLTYFPSTPSTHGSDPRYPVREKRQVHRYDPSAKTAVALRKAYAEPQSIAEALSSPDAENWKEAIDREVESLFRQNTW